jgi:hypothetical protein
VERFELDTPVGTDVVCAMSGMFTCRCHARDGCKKKGKHRGGRSLASETIDPDGHCRKLVERIVEADVGLKMELDHGTTYKLHPPRSEIETPWHTYAALLVD